MLMKARVSMYIVSSIVELSRGAWLAWLEHGPRIMCSPHTQEFPFVYNWGLRSPPYFYLIKSLCN